MGTNKDLQRKGKTYAKLYERLKGQEEKEEKDLPPPSRSIFSRSITTLTSFFYKDASVQTKINKSDKDMELGLDGQRDSVEYAANARAYCSFYPLYTNKLNRGVQLKHCLYVLKYRRRHCMKRQEQHRLSGVC